jgi:hypothetical protein
MHEELPASVPRQCVLQTYHQERWPATASDGPSVAVSALTNDCRRVTWCARRIHLYPSGGGGGRDSATAMASQWKGVDKGRLRYGRLLPFLGSIRGIRQSSFIFHRSSFTVHLSSSIFLSAVDQAQSRRQLGLLTVAIVRGRGEGDQRGSRGMRRD